MSKQKSFSSDLRALSELTRLSPAEIKLQLGIPLNLKSRASSIIQARENYKLSLPGSERQMAELKRWEELFLIDLQACASLEESIDLRKHEYVPETTSAQLEFLKKVATFFNVNFASACLEKMYQAGSLEKAIELGFEYLSLGRRFVGPQGKLILLCALSPQNNQGGTIQVISCADNNPVLFNASRGKNDINYVLTSPYEQKIEDWSNQW